MIGTLIDDQIEETWADILETKDDDITEAEEGDESEEREEESNEDDGLDRFNKTLASHDGAAELGEKLTFVNCRDEKVKNC